MQDFRRSLPEQSRLIVCKNTLLKQAVDKAGNGFSELSQAAKVRAMATTCASTFAMRRSLYLSVHS